MKRSRGSVTGPSSGDHFDALVVGSGFGGSVTAYRLAEACLSVCLLERGKAYAPGSFPRSPLDMQKNFWDPSEGLHGLFDVWSFRGLEAIVSSGLGGGSLIYANVLLRKDEKWFVREDPHDRHYEYWPVTRADLDPHYDAVEAILQPTPYPVERSPYAETAKSRAFCDAVDAVIRRQGPSVTQSLPPLAVKFARPGFDPAPGEALPTDKSNYHNRPRYTCRLCGECDIGCNYGSKNTLDHTYLSRAKVLGASIRTRSEVRSIRWIDGKFAIDYVVHEPGAEGHRTDTSRLPLRRVTANRLVLAAGTLGTNHLLLRNRKSIPGISKTLGTRFGGNGDLLSFAWRCMTKGPNGNPEPRALRADSGPVITRTARFADSVDSESRSGGRGFYVQDAGYPEFLNWILQTTSVPGQILRYLRFAYRYVAGTVGLNPDSDLSAELSEVMHATEASYSTLPLLGIGRDIADGRMHLRGKWLAVDWTMKTSETYFERLTAACREIATELGGDFRETPSMLLSRTISVHPLGGCPMGRSIEDGVVDSYGRVFGCPGMYIADGSIMPGPVGTNPSLTIAALADRCASAILNEIDEARAPNRPLKRKE